RMRVLLRRDSHQLPHLRYALRFPSRSDAMRHAFAIAFIAFAPLALAGCGESARLTVHPGMGPLPQLPPPNTTLIPTVQTAKAVGWSNGEHPTAAPGLSVQAFARDLDHPRWLYTLPNGDVLVAETNAPPKPDDSKGIKGWIAGLIMAGAGAGV